MNVHPRKPKFARARRNEDLRKRSPIAFSPNLVFGTAMSIFLRKHAFWRYGFNVSIKFISEFSNVTFGV